MVTEDQEKRDRIPLGIADRVVMDAVHAQSTDRERIQGVAAAAAAPLLRKQLPESLNAATDLS